MKFKDGCLGVMQAAVVVVAILAGVVVFVARKVNDPSAQDKMHLMHNI